MTEKQYLLQRLLHLSSFLSTATSEKEKRNLENAIVFYARELEKVDKKQQNTHYIQ